MLERRSALASAHPFDWAALTIKEARGFTLTQAAVFAPAEEAALAAIAGALPADGLQAVESHGRSVFRIAPLAFWFVGPESDDLATRLKGAAIVTPLSHSRTRIAVEGRAARDVLRQGIALDFDADKFTPGRFALTGLHHTPVLVHCTGAQSFALYAMRTFALNVFEWLEDAGAAYR
jgi:heterotetrameric sarcosine oxidase gamma subunit